MLEFRYRVTEEDYLRFNREFMLHSKGGKTILWTYRLTAIICSACFVLLAALVGDLRKAAALAAGLALFCAAMWLNAKKLLLRTCDRSVRRLKRDGKLPYSETGTLTFSQDDIREENAQSTAAYHYDAIERTALSRGAVYVFFSAMQAFILPESAFSGDEERQALLGLLKEKTRKPVEVWEQQMRA